jgi:hypothetical protein
MGALLGWAVAVGSPGCTWVPVIAMMTAAMNSLGNFAIIDLHLLSVVSVSAVAVTGYGVGHGSLGQRQTVPDFYCGRSLLNAQPALANRSKLAQV